LLSYAQASIAIGVLGLTLDIQAIVLGCKKIRWLSFIVFFKAFCLAIPSLVLGSFALIDGLNNWA
jgi:hypothetical protein